MKPPKNPAPNPNSKTQQQKREYLLKHPLQRVVCDKCKRGNVTLRKHANKYYCEEHYKEVANG